MKFPDLTRSVLLQLCSRMELKDLPYWDGDDIDALAFSVNALAVAIADRLGSAFEEPEERCDDESE